MSRVDEAGVEHPVASDEFTSEGLEHIGHCPECRALMPWLNAGLPDHLRK